MNFYLCLFSDQLNIKMKTSQIAKPSWCTCNKCTIMPMEVENVCCKGSGQDQTVCRTDDDAFKTFYRNLWSQNTTERSEKRRECYEKTVGFFNEQKWYPFECGKQHAPLPSCVLRRIRQKYPDPTNSYTGFPPKDELLKQAVEAHRTFQKDMKKCLDVVDVVHPKTGLLTAVSNLEEPHVTKLKEILPQRRQGNDPYKVNPAIDFLLQSALVANAAALEAYTEEIKSCCIDAVFSSAAMTQSDFIDWLNSRLSNDEFAVESDKEFFKEYLGYTTTKVKRKDLWSELSKMLEIEPLSQNAINLTQTVLHYKKNQLKRKDKKPTLHDLRKTFVSMAEKRARTREPITQGAQLQETKSGDESMITKEPSPSTSTDPRHHSHTRKQGSPTTSTQLKSTLPYDSPGKTYQPSTSKPKNAKGQKRRMEPDLQKSKATKKARCGESEQQQPRSDNRISEEEKTKIETDIKNLMMSIIQDPQKPWKILRQKSDEKTGVKQKLRKTRRPISEEKISVKCTNYSSLAHVSNLFYGIRSLFAHGTDEYTTQTGVLSEMHAPKSPSDFDIKIIKRKQTPSDKTECEKYLFDLLTEARKKGNKMKVDYNLFWTMHSFYQYFAAKMGKMCACIACGLCDKRLLQKASKAGGTDIKKIEDLLEKANWQQAVSKTEPEQTRHTGLTVDIGELFLSQQ